MSTLGKVHRNQYKRHLMCQNVKMGQFQPQQYLRAKVKYNHIAVFWFLEKKKLHIYILSLAFESLTDVIMIVAIHLLAYKKILQIP